MRKSTGVLVGLAFAACVQLANASLVINYSINGGSTMSCGSGTDDGPVTCSITGSGVSVSVVTATSNSPGTSGGAEQFADTVEATSTVNASVRIWVTAQDFTMPTTPPGLTYESSLSGTSVLGNSSSTAGLKSCIDTTNGPAPPLGCGGGTLTNTPETFTGAMSLSNTVFGTVTSLSGTYALEQLITLSLTPSSDFNIDSSQSLSAVPEPASIVLLGTLLVGIATIFRKKLARQS
jgi:hypothetical protein